MKNARVAEELFTFGDDRRLVGTISLPSASGMPEPGPGGGAVALILFNAGVISRIGPHRLYVKLARQAARAGVPALRFDLSGQGDSLPSAATSSFERQSVSDVRRAMDEMSARTGVTRFALFGICSGAVLSYAAALEDPRVVGCAMLDPYMYPTLKTHFTRLLTRLHERGLREVAAGWLKRRVADAIRLARRTGAPSGPKSDPNGGLGLQKPEQRVFAEGLHRLLDRDVALMMIFSGSALYTYNYEKQFDDGFRRYGLAGRIRADLLPEIDHTVTELAAQAQLIRHLLAWVDASFTRARHGSAGLLE